MTPASSPSVYLTPDKPVVDFAHSVSNLDGSETDRKMIWSSDKSGDLEQQQSRRLRTRLRPSSARN